MALPIISNIQVSDFTPTQGTNVTIECDIDLQGESLFSANLEWGEGDYSNVTALKEKVILGTYEATIPGQSGGTDVQWRIVVITGGGSSTEIGSPNIIWNADPVLSNLIISTTTPDTGDSVIVSVDIDLQGGTLITSEIQYGEGDYSQTANLIFQSGTTYQGTIPGQLNGTTIINRVYAETDIGSDQLNGSPITWSDPAAGDFAQIPLSNTLRMVRTDNQSGTLQNFDNRLLHQEDYIDYNDRPYAQKISSSDDILIQYATNYSPVTAKIYDLEDNEVIDVTNDITLILESTTFNVYNLLFNIAAQGYYYLKIDFDSSTEVYESEIFQIDGFTEENMLKIEYNTSETDGIIYDNNETFVIRVEGRLAEYEPGQNKEMYTSFNETLVNLKSYPTREFTMEWNGIPRYMVEKLNLAFSHELVKINDVEYQSKDAPDSELLKDGVIITNLYMGKVRLQQVDYENYIRATDDIEDETFHILIDGSGNKLILKQDSTDYFTRYKN
jgi:hypothetical protein